ncbi:MAG TPA: polymer-forming cytoskeletal protein [Myxococcota bacterium]|nr:polymer-forming cytoskeletal protein [Myxococcota bacterium]
MATRPGWRRIRIGATAAPTPPPQALAEAAKPIEDFARIERGVEMSGRLATSRSLRVEGEFRGEIESGGAVVVAESGAVEAPIRARTVEIFGAVVGDVSAGREIVIHPTGRLHGDVDAPSLVVMRGAFFNGKTRMYRPERSLAQTDAMPAAVAAPGDGAQAG